MTVLFPASHAAANMVLAATAGEDRSEPEWLVTDEGDVALVFWPHEGPYEQLVQGGVIARDQEQAESAGTIRPLHLAPTTSLSRALAVANLYDFPKDYAYQSDIEPKPSALPEDLARDVICDILLWVQSVGGRTEYALEMALDHFNEESEE